MSIVDDDVALKTKGSNRSEGSDMEVLLEALLSLRKGDFSVRLPCDWTGIEGKVADTFNDVMDQLEGMTERS